MYVSTSAQPRDAINNLGVYVQQQGTTCGFTGHDAWVVLNPIEQSIKRKIESVGKPLRDWDINIFRGVLTGYNDAFIITTQRRDEILSNCKSEEERQRTNDIIRPILRGRDIKRYSYDWAGLWLINTHNGVKGKIPRIDINDYPAIKAHLDKFWDKIQTRADQGDTPYNLRNCAYSDDFSQPKIVWGNLSLTASYALVDKEYYVNAPSPMIVPASKYLLAILNSRLADFYIQLLGVTRNGGYFEYKPIFVERLPVPVLKGDNPLLLKIERLVDSLDSQAIDQRVFDLYGLSEEERDYLNKRQK